MNQPSSYRLIPINDTAFRVERYINADVEWQPIQVIKGLNGTIHWAIPSLTSQITGAVFSAGTKDQCVKWVDRLKKYDASSEKATTGVDETKIVYL